METTELGFFYLFDIYLFDMLLTDHLPGRTLMMNEEEYLFFSGTSYLGMGHQPEFKAALIEGMNRYGTIYSASRNNNLQLEIYSTAEKYLAEINKAEATLTVSSGLLAGQLVVKSLSEHHFIYAPSVHPALWNEVKISGQFLDYQDFYTKINEFLLTTIKPVVICCNSVDPLHCITYDFGWISSLPKNKDITLIFDDSHAIGITTDLLSTDPDHTHGKGNFNKFLQLAGSNVNVIVVSSFAKALGIPGGIIMGKLETINKIRNSPFFVGASPIVPAYLHAFMHSSKLYCTAKEALQKNIASFKKLNRDILYHFRYLREYPVFYTERDDVYNLLFREKIMISSFAYPNPDDKPLTRIVLSALHSEADIHHLSVKLHSIFSKEIS